VARLASTIAGLTIIWAAIGAALILPTTTKAHDADYTVAVSDYYTYNPALVVGPNGTLLLKSGDLSSYLDLSEVSGHYASATGYNRVSVPSGTADCGYADGCVMFDVHNTTNDWWPSCTTESVSAGYWAETRVALAGALNNTGCSGLGAQSIVWIVGVNPSNVPNNWWAYQHVGRHEAGHALGMNEAGHSCWSDSGLYYPLMNNNPNVAACGYAHNVYLTPHEVSAVISLNGWN
jgi:hypothetical protein